MEPRLPLYTKNIFREEFTMNALTKIKTTAQVLGAVRRLGNYNIDYLPARINSGKFITMREAASQIEDGTTVITAGMGSHGRPAFFFQAVREVFLKTGRPANLNWISVSAQGNRGKRAGSVEDLDVPGLLSEYLTGHLETAKRLLDMGENRDIELHTLPQGEITELLVAQAAGKTTVENYTGIGTFLDPDLGGTSAITPHTEKSYISKVNGKIAYTMPKIDVAAFYAPYADREGNIYFKHASSRSECIEAAMAANKNGGKVIVWVSDIIEKNEAEISLAHEQITSISVNPWAEQSAMTPQKRYFKALTEGASEDPEGAFARMKFINELTRVYSKRKPEMFAMARMAASVLIEISEKSSLVNFGIGLPEEVAKMIYQGGAHERFTFSSEAGAYGGIPCQGLYFGGSVNPERLTSSAWMFDHYKENLDVTVLGILQVDSQGNVNVSKRGDKVTEYVGPGGFMNISSSAKKIIFIGTFMARADIKLKKGQVTVRKSGIPKFVDQVMEITFPAREAMKQGKEVHYVTDLGVFRLTEEGLVLTQVMPGVDIEKDIIRNATAKIQVADQVETILRETVTGKNFRLGS